ncbi:hypothetical protein N0V82_007386 [Gnomoniopsis sp. IMI 355080]|nr:hypothetical protein N0V82_007386 [Gnomoniopsis sp. IMI 355080]
MVDMKENTKVAAEVLDGQGASHTVSRNEHRGSHEDGDVDEAEVEKQRDDEDDATDDAGSHADIDTENDSGVDSDSTEGDEASRSLPNFWEKAWISDKVGDNRRSVLQQSLVKPAGSAKRSVPVAPRSSSQKAAVDGVIKNTQERMASYTARWGSADGNTTLGMGRSILLSAQTVKTLLDSVVQFDPTGYSSAAWTVISFSLTLVKNDQDLMELTFKSCDYLADLMARYARIEAYYRESQEKRDKALERALVSVYVSILVYAAEVQESHAARPLTRFKKSITSLTGQPLADLKNEIYDENAKLEEWQRVVDRERAAKVDKMLNSIEGDTDELLKKVDELAKDTKEKFIETIRGIKKEELRELLKSLRELEGKSQPIIRQSIEDEIAWWKSSEDDQRKLRTLKSKARAKKSKDVVRFEDSEDEGGRKINISDEEGSEVDDADDHVLDKEPMDDEFGGWLFQMQEYSDWIKYPQGLLWLYGNSGCGKSALCSAITKDLKKTFGKDYKTKVFAAWHLRFDFDESKKLNLMLASLLRQLGTKCQRFPDDNSFSTLQGYQGDGELPTDTKELLGCLKKFISKIDRDVFLVLDGIDQCTDRHGMRNSDRKLLDIIGELAYKGYPNLHMLVISRDEKDIRSYFKKNMQEMLISVNVRKGLGEALDTLINRKLEGTAMTTMLKGDQEMKKKIDERLRHDGKASNSLWASSVLRQVFQCRDVEEIKQALERIPDSINTRYHTALSKVAEVDKDRMKRILLWLRWQERPLSQAEFVAAVSVPSAAAVTEICSRVLIETAKESVQVAGRLRTLEVFRFTHFSVREYLSALEQEAPKIPTKITRLVRSPGEDAHLQITRLCLGILSDCTSSQKTRTTATVKTGSDTDWNIGAGTASDSDDSSSKTGDRDDDSDVSGAGAASTDSDDDRQSISTDNSAADGGSPSWPARRYAAEHWFRHYVKIDREKVLREASGQLDKLETDICSQVLGGTHNDIMRFWLRTHDPDGELNETVPSPVYYAVKLKLENIPMRLINCVAQLPTGPTDLRVALLDQPGADGTALQLAAHQGDAQLLEELIKHEANVNSERGPHGTAVYAAAARGDKGMVEKLLRAGAELDGEDHGDLGSPLHVAAYWGHNTIVEFLLEEGGLAVDQRANPFGTALQAASAAGHATTVELLLDKKADPNFVGGCLGTAAQGAFTHDEGKLNTVIDILRSRDAQFIDTPGALFWTGAYERATDLMMLGRDTTEEYTRLLRHGSPTSWQPRVVELGARQDLLASVISQWTLPMAAQPLDSDRWSMWLTARIPFQDQMDAIRRAVPNQKVDIHNLCHSDFMYKACFWAGINYILGKLSGLVGDFLNQAIRQLRRYEHGRYANSSPVLPFRWAWLGDPFDPHLSYLSYRMRHKEASPRLRARLSREQWFQVDPPDIST